MDVHKEVMAIAVMRRRDAGTPIARNLARWHGLISDRRRTELSSSALNRLRHGFAVAGGELEGSRWHRNVDISIGRDLAPGDAGSDSSSHRV